MKVSRRNISLLLSLLLILFSITVTARADDDDEPDDYDVKARVVRISLIDGEVNLKRNGNQDWERSPAELSAGRRRHCGHRQRQPARDSNRCAKLRASGARTRSCVSSLCVMKESR